MTRKSKETSDRKRRATGSGKRPKVEQPPLVLLVDDYDDAREMYAEYLVFRGFRVAEARDGHDALSKALSEKPSLILMDLSLPGMDGWEATRRLKLDPRTRDVPVIALTGHAMVGHSEGAMRAGCDGFLTKPCLPEDVAREVERVLGVSPRGGGGRP